MVLGEIIKMNCQEIKKLMGAYVFGDLEPHEMKLVRTHAQDCSDCYEDLIARTQVSINLGESLPTLSDADRLMITRGVRERIRLEENYKPGVFSKLIPALGLCGLMVIGFGLGRLIAQKPIAQKTIGFAISHSGSKNIPKLPFNTANSIHNSKPNSSIIDNVKKKIGESAVNNLGNFRSLGVTNRGVSNNRKGHTIILDEPLPIIDETTQSQVDNKPVENNSQLKPEQPISGEQTNKNENP